MKLKFISGIAIISLLNLAACNKEDGTQKSLVKSLSFEKAIDLIIIEATKQVTTLTGDGKIAGRLFKSEDDFKNAVTKAEEAINKASKFDKLSDNQREILKRLENNLNNYVNKYLNKD